MSTALLETPSVSIIFIDGYFSEKTADQHLFPKEMVLSTIREALITHPHLISSDEWGAALDGVFLYLPKNIIMPSPVHMLFIQKNKSTCLYNKIIVDEHSQINILEEYKGEAISATHTTTKIDAKKNSKVHYHKIQNESIESTHESVITIHQSKDSVVNSHILSIGSRLAREHLQIHLNERGAESQANGFYCLQHDKQKIEHHVQIDHHTAHGRSDLIYKGMAKNRSHAIFNGKIFVHPAAQKTQANLLNQNLLLSNDAQMDTKPEFEIYADDVKCAHGSTVGQLDTELLFYLRSRGIEKNTALTILIFAFSADIMRRISHAAISKRMNQLLNETLEHESEF